MTDFQVRPTLATDLPRLMGMNHMVESDSVWQLELRREARQLFATFREVRLPRPTAVAYPNNPFALADDWSRKAMMFTALSAAGAIGYLVLVQREAASVAWVTDLAVDGSVRRQGVAGLLLSAAHGWAAERSHRRLVLEVQSKNIPAIRMAQKFGYEFCGYNDHQYLTQDVALFFAKTLKRTT
jgi:GNAT superfamily N-acetyltransferase